ncbi:MAG: zf-HC2 domain-containing protein, partial [Desulfobacteraceae bacterium]|nr:zf-HC2 domain-containing protein [Desulfobacteraceae bacterium]
MTAECRHEICLSLFEKMSDYIDRELDETTCQDIEKHASECFACKVCLET